MRPPWPHQRAYLIGLAAILSAALAGLWWLFGQSQHDDVWTQVQASGVLRVGTDASYPPFENLDASGVVVGFDADLASEIARRLGLKAEFVNITYDGLNDALLTGKVDVLISALADLPQAAGKARFTLPYFNAGEMLVVKSDSSLRSMEDLEGRVLAVEVGSGGDVEARKWQRRLSRLMIARYPDPDAALGAVLGGKADGALVDGIAARLAVGQNPELELAGNVNDTLFAVAAKSDSRELRTRLDETIQSMHQDGTIDRLIDRWFGPQRWVSSR